MKSICASCCSGSSAIQALFGCVRKFGLVKVCQDLALTVSAKTIRLTLQIRAIALSEKLPCISAKSILSAIDKTTHWRSVQLPCFAGASVCLCARKTLILWVSCMSVLSLDNWVRLTNDALTVALCGSKVLPLSVQYVFHSNYLQRLWSFIDAWSGKEFERYLSIPLNHWTRVLVVMGDSLVQRQVDGRPLLQMQVPVWNWNLES